jgi:Polyketide cyclase / dehydrase and lipid transport
MEYRPRALFTNAAVAAVAVVPIAVAFVHRAAGTGTWAPFLPLWGVALIAIFATFLLLNRAAKLQRTRAGQAMSPGRAEGSVRWTVVVAGLMVVAEVAIVASIDWQVAVIAVALVVAWILVWTPRASRRLVMRSAIDVRCTPQAAFELVSNPNHWPLYVPEIELVQPVDVPVRLGTVIHERVRRDGRILLEAEEDVVALEPGKRFGTSVRKAQPSSGIYEIGPVADGMTHIEYTHRSVLSLPTAILGGALMRGGLGNKMAAGRAKILERIKGLLQEAQGAPERAPL